jgi:hypothetical protein
MEEMLGDFMSDELTKEKHSRRLQQEENAIKKQVKIAKQYGVDKKYTEQPHRFAKHHVLNCGNPKCVMCANPRHTFGEKTIQEKRFEQTEKWREE